MQQKPRQAASLLLSLVLMSALFFQADTRNIKNNAREKEM